MPIIKFSDSDFNAGRVVSTGWYKAEITEIDGPKVSQSGKTVNFFTKFVITDGEFAGKELTIVMNSGMQNPSVLGTAQFMPHSAFIDIACAVLNVGRNEVSKELDTDSLLRRPLDIKVEKIIQDNIPINTIIQFLPPGKGADATVPF